MADTQRVNGKLARRQLHRLVRLVRVARTHRVDSRMPRQMCRDNAKWKTQRDRSRSQIAADEQERDFALLRCC